MSFCEIQMPTGISRGATGGPVFSSVVVSSASGNEQRIAQWSQGRRKWDVSHALRNNTQRDELIDFFTARRGMFEGFRFKDWSDFRILPANSSDADMITTTTFQLVKRYISGGVTILRKITKPVDGTLRIWDGSTEITTGWIINNSTGVITFDDAPDYLPSASFEFDVPARFNTDEMNWSQEETTFGSWNSVPIIEIVNE